MHVTGPTGEAAALALTARWREVRDAGRPWVTGHLAQSLDGHAAAADGTSQWITGPDSRVHAHEAVSYTHLTLPTTLHECRSRWSPYH